MGGDVQQPMSNRTQAAALIRDVIQRCEHPGNAEADRQWIRRASQQLSAEEFQEIVEVVRDEWPELEQSATSSLYEIALTRIFTFRSQSEPDLVDKVIDRIMNLEHCRWIGLRLAWSGSSDPRQYWDEFAAAAQSEVDPFSSWIYRPCQALGLAWPQVQSLEALASELIAGYPGREVICYKGPPMSYPWEDEEEVVAYVFAATVEAFLGLYSVAKEFQSCTTWSRVDGDSTQLNEAQIIVELLRKRFWRDRELVRLVVKRIADDPRLDPLALQLAYYMPFEQATSWLISKAPQLDQWPDFAQEEYRFRASMLGL